MADKKAQQKGRKIGRNKRSKDMKMSAYVKGIITFEKYNK